MRKERIYPDVREKLGSEGRKEQKKIDKDEGESERGEPEEKAIWVARLDAVTSTRASRKQKLKTSSPSQVEVPQTEPLIGLASEGGLVSRIERRGVLVAKPQKFPQEHSLQSLGFYVQGLESFREGNTAIKEVRPAKEEVSEKILLLPTLMNPLSTLA